MDQIIFKDIYLIEKESEHYLNTYNKIRKMLNLNYYLS